MEGPKHENLFYYQKLFSVLITVDGITENPLYEKDRVMQFLWTTHPRIWAIPYTRVLDIHFFCGKYWNTLEMWAIQNFCQHIEYITLTCPTASFAFCSIYMYSPRNWVQSMNGEERFSMLPFVIRKVLNITDSPILFRSKTKLFYYHKIRLG